MRCRFSAASIIRLGSARLVEIQVRHDRDSSPSCNSNPQRFKSSYHYALENGSSTPPVDVKLEAKVEASSTGCACCLLKSAIGSLETVGAEVGGSSIARAGASEASRVCRVKKKKEKRDAVAASGF
ncbi:unnamed protein product [Linum trigynum]|uniref:Uncharacterized protein n=1 Tax=Linum trigynum TaxID=586398 RepID=A0AAV2E0L1_9ROSI